jgi:hypothetical protein
MGKGETFSLCILTVIFGKGEGCPFFLSGDFSLSGIIWQDSTVLIPLVD